VIGEVTAVDITARDPLLFHGGRFRYLGPIETHWSGSIDCPDRGWFDTSAVFTPLALA
jgi:hypothetical protein